jgi:hypothetical protein
MLPGKKTEPRFSQPTRQILSMVVVLALTVMGGIALYPAVAPIFFTNIYLNGFIVTVFLFGVLACFWQVFTMISAVNWIEGFALDRPGHEFTKPPRLLAPLAAMLANRQARRSVTSTSARSILDTVANRLDEQRDLTRYIVNLLIFLGLLGTFYGLATVVPAVVDTIRSLAPEEGQSAISVFDNLMAGSRTSSRGWARPSPRRCSGLPGRWWSGCSSSSPATGRTASTASSRSGFRGSPRSGSGRAMPRTATAAPISSPRWSRPRCRSTCCARWSRRGWRARPRPRRGSPISPR